MLQDRVPYEKPRVLLLEDSPSHYKGELEKQGYKVMQGCTYLDGVFNITEYRIDLVMINMSNGLRFLRDIKTHIDKFKHNIPIIFQTDYDSDEIPYLLSQNGVYTISRNPKNQKSLTDLVVRVLRRTASANTRAGQSTTPLSDGTVESLIEEAEGSESKDERLVTTLARKRTFEEKGSLLVARYVF